MICDSTGPRGQTEETRFVIQIRSTGYPKNMLCGKSRTTHYWTTTTTTLWCTPHPQFPQFEFQYCQCSRHWDFLLASTHRLLVDILIHSHPHFPGLAVYQIDVSALLIFFSRSHQIAVEDPWLRLCSSLLASLLHYQRYPRQRQHWAERPRFVHRNNRRLSIY